MERKLYEGLKVIDATNNYAGPMAGAMLADYGADVIHIEKPVLGDDNRFFPPIIDGISINYCVSNRGKKSLVLDLKDPRGAESFKKLAKDADVILESYRPGVMERLGLDYQAIREINPKIVYCSVSAYGQTGPYADRPGYDVIAQAVSGMMEMTGEPDGAPTKIGSAIGDWVGALNAFGCIGTALYYRERTGRGQHIDIALARSLMWMAAKLDHGITGTVATRTGNHHSNLAPYGIFQGNHGESVVIGALSSNLWTKLCNVMNRPELTEDPRFISNDQRVENKHILIEMIEEWLKSLDSVNTAVDALIEAGVPCTKIYNMMDIDEDLHYNACGWIADMPMANDMMSVRTRRFPSNPFTFSEIQAQYGAAPNLGESNHEILEQLGLSAEEVDAMEGEWEEKAKSKS
ncbi:CoA transferase [Oscillibacter sp.]|uniref:CaiB/BaiF CoA transferase family protein n=1 Tax=Oscillibacter sp. TaxID=1945593 RepID=UPI0028A1C50E|nr:CoA transferase [Oscillibacter sp.]